MFDLDPKDQKILKQILEPVGLKFYVFGSRVKGENSKFSDLDLCYKGEMSKQTLIKIKDELTESLLPFFVDLVDYNDCDTSFKELIDKDLVYFCG